jgi:hypothetical protein
LIKTFPDPHVRPPSPTLKKAQEFDNLLNVLLVLLTKRGVETPEETNTGKEKKVASRYLEVRIKSEPEKRRERERERGNQSSAS